MTSLPVLRCEGLTKTYVQGFLRRKVHALAGITFAVERGEIFGFLGPNGAGKSTTFKILVGLLFPTAGRAEILGLPAGAREARRHLGFLPENPYFYEYLTGREFLEYVGNLFGLPSALGRRRAGELIEQVGLSAAADRALRKYSKGMLQRAGIAQALMGDPDLVIFDEPMTGLDPFGRKEVRDFILSLRERGKTVVFSSHILPDVELICDRVAIVFQGGLRDVGPLAQLVSARVMSTEIVLDQASDDLAARLRLADYGVQPRGNLLQVIVPENGDPHHALHIALTSGARVVQMTPRQETLEDVFVRVAAPPRAVNA